jgi:hypothetical protein
MKRITEEVATFILSLSRRHKGVSKALFYIFIPKSPEGEFLIYT